MNAAALKLKRLQTSALLVAGVGIVLSIIAILLNADRFLAAYLFAFVFWTGAGLGCLGLLLLNAIAGGRWGAVLRRVFEAGALTLPVMLICFVPLALTLNRLYPWARNPHELSPHKAQYLSHGFFIARTFFYFTLWSIGALLIRRASFEQERADPDAARRIETVSAPGLLLYVLSASFAAFDWTMTLEPDWYSTIYGMSAIVSQGLTGMLVGILALNWIRDTDPAARIVGRGDFHDFGNLLLVFVMLSAYMSLSQFLIIWSGNLPEEAVWYIRRSRGGWQLVAAFLAACHFFAPFLVLLFRNVKRNAARLAMLAAGLALAHACEWYWLVLPVFDAEFSPKLADFAAFIALGGIWTSAFVFFWRRAPLFAPEEFKLPAHSVSHESLPEVTETA